jgi:hypothetical protein
VTDKPARLSPEQQMNIRVRRRGHTQILRILATDREDRQLGKFMAEVVVPGLDTLPYDWEVEEDSRDPYEAWTEDPAPEIRLDLLEGQVSRHETRLDRLETLLRAVVTQAMTDAPVPPGLLLALEPDGDEARDT